jgi:hypothetical protein
MHMLYGAMDSHIHGGQEYGPGATEDEKSHSRAFSPTSETELVSFFFLEGKGMSCFEYLRPPLILFLQVLKTIDRKTQFRNGQGKHYAEENAVSVSRCAVSPAVGALTEHPISQGLSWRCFGHSLASHWRHCCPIVWICQT